ncbi:MAG: tRNA 2-thiouridine(34) synthase MnmA [Pseudomonadota bacterium]
MKHPVVAIALSGGVDSLVSGYLLKQKYKHIFGIHFITGYEREPTDLVKLEHQLGFDIHTIDLSFQFEKQVVQYIVKTYLLGKTPNPCLICNREIKFGELLNYARAMGADYLATGHYATIVNPVSFPDQNILHNYLEKGKDQIKDQSYFLSLLTEQQLEHIIFPLAGMIKQDVKALAKSVGISPIQPSESQDICFIHDNNLAQFILQKEQIQPEPGPIIDIQGKIVGRHNGLHQFTIGQRRGINCPSTEPYYVQKIDMAANQLVVCFKKDLSTQIMMVDKINWNSSLSGTIDNITTKIRYAHKGALSTLTLDKNFGRVIFNQPQNAVTPGQGAVFYKENRVLGAGIIQ